MQRLTRGWARPAEPQLAKHVVTSGRLCRPKSKSTEPHWPPAFALDEGKGEGCRAAARSAKAGRAAGPAGRATARHASQEENEPIAVHSISRTSGCLESCRPYRHHCPTRIGGRRPGWPLRRSEVSGCCLPGGCQKTVGLDQGTGSPPRRCVATSSER